MEIVVIDSKGSNFQFPVNPPEIRITRDKRYETVDILNFGEVDFPNGKKIQEVSFSSFFPRDYDEGYCAVTSLLDPNDCAKMLEEWVDEADPVRLIIPDLKINMLTQVSTNPLMIKGGEPGDIYFDITFRSWREIKVRTSAEPIASAGGDSASGSGSTSASSTAAASRSDTKAVDNPYLVKSGDCLFSIAKIQLGSGSRWKEIYSMNTSTIGQKPELIQPGMELRMPA